MMRFMWFEAAAAFGAGRGEERAANMLCLNRVPKMTASKVGARPVLAPSDLNPEADFLSP